MLLFGIASGVAMIPYTIIKEANPDEVKGSATGGINFIPFGLTSCLSPVFALYFGKTLGFASNAEVHFRSAGIFLLAAISLALILSFVTSQRAAEKLFERKQNALTADELQ